MKYFLLLVMLLGLAVVSAEDFGAGETAQFYFENVSFDSEDVNLYYNYTTLIDINPFVNEIGTVDILYFDLPVNCSLGIYFLDYSDGNLMFNVIDSASVMRISPTYYVFDKMKSSFYVELTSVKGSFDVNITGINVEPRKDMISLNYGEKKKLYVDYDNVSSDGSLELSYGNLSYTINLYYLAEEPVVVKNQTIVNETIEPVVNETVVEKIPLTFLVTSPTENVSLVYNESIVGALKVQNTFGEKLIGLSYKLTGDIANVVSFREETIDLEAEEIYPLDFVFNENENASIGNYFGEIVFGNEDYEVKLPVVVFVNNVESARTDESENAVFGKDIIFEGQTLEEESGNGLLIIGIVLVVLMLFFIIVVILKLRQKQEKKFNQFIEETKKK